MSHHPTFRKIYCDAVPYLFKKVRYSLWALSPWPYSFIGFSVGLSLASFVRDCPTVLNMLRTFRRVD
jgi:hypothetical protein